MLKIRDKHAKKKAKPHKKFRTPMGALGTRYFIHFLATPGWHDFVGEQAVILADRNDFLLSA
jgi:hypothetical protein